MFESKKIKDCFPISSKVILLLILSLNLLSCVAERNDVFPQAVSVEIDEELVLITAPEGFCIDQESAKRSGKNFTVFAVDCIKIKTDLRDTSGRRPISAILTATISSQNKTKFHDIDKLEHIFLQKPGLALLSRSNSSALLKVHEVKKEGNVLLVYAEQREVDIDVVRSPFFWRAFFFMDEKLISLTSSNFLHQSNSKKILRNLILEFSKNIIASNNRTELVGKKI